MIQNSTWCCGSFQLTSWANPFFLHVPFRLTIKHVLTSGEKHKIHPSVQYSIRVSKREHKLSLGETVNPSNDPPIYTLRNRGDRDQIHAFPSRFAHERTIAIAYYNFQRPCRSRPAFFTSLLRLQMAYRKAPATRPTSIGLLFLEPFDRFLASSPKSLSTRSTNFQSLSIITLLATGDLLLAAALMRVS